MKQPFGRCLVFARPPAQRQAAADPPSPVEPQDPPLRTTTPVTRSVPVPIEALTQMLNVDPTMRMRLRHLALVEHSCLRSPAEPFAHLPPRAIEIAVRQLDAVLPRQPTLRVLRLQLERHLQTHRTRTLALLAAADLKWLPEGATAATSACLAPDSISAAHGASPTSWRHCRSSGRPVAVARGHPLSCPPASAVQLV